MLKIRENVDLKELEKFGFEYVVQNYQEMWAIVKKYDTQKRRHSKSQLTLFSVKKLDRVITHATFNGADELLFNLITAGLVEKVVENNE